MSAEAVPLEHKIDPWFLALHLGESLTRQYCDQHAATRRKTNHPNAPRGQRPKREQALEAFSVAVINDGDAIEIRCRDERVAAWTTISQWHEKLASAHGYMPIMVRVRVVGWGKVR